MENSGAPMAAGETDVLDSYTGLDGEEETPTKPPSGQNEVLKSTMGALGGEESDRKASMGEKRRMATEEREHTMQALMSRKTQAIVVDIHHQKRNMDLGNRKGR